MNVVSIIQARLGSTRLPRKILEPIGNHPAVWHTIARVKVATEAVVLAVPAGDYDEIRDALKPYKGFAIYGCGGIKEDDVLHRYHECARLSAADVIVRVTGDCPFISPGRISSALRLLKGDLEYVSNTITRTYPRGLDVEVFTRPALEDAFKLAVSPKDREHVTPWMKRHCRVVELTQNTHHENLRWTLDTAEDLAWFRKIAESTDVEPPHPFYLELLELLRARPDLQHEEAT